MINSPINHFQFKEFDFSSYLAYKREEFIGRKWFFSEMESIFEESPGIAGVLITAEPGSGKSALMSQLICSLFSSLLIHENIIGYHLCDYSEQGKRDGARFVRNLVDQIAARLPEYAEHVMNNEQLRTELDERCHKDSIACFFSTIVGPLRKIEQPDDFGFIIIDALDECFESDMKTSEIMDILNSKIIHFPKWLKVVLTSRNLTSVTFKLPRMINRTSLYATDERNVQDIRYYVSRFVSQNSDFSDRLLTAIDIRSRPDGMKMFLDEVITRAEGNFLYMKTTLQYMIDTDGKVDLHSLPTNLFDLYNIFFNRQFGEDRFGPFRPLFEVLLSAYSPLDSQDVKEILKMEYKAADISKLIDQVSSFLRFSRDGTVRIYHQSFAEWLKDQTHVLAINQTRGHESIAKFLLRRLRERHVDITFEELSELFIHILLGRAFEIQKTALDLFNIFTMRESQTNQSILHYLVTKPSIYLPVLDFFLQKFQMVDVLDANHKTPAFYAASEGVVQSLQSCINNGADVGSFLEGYTELDPISIVVRNTGIEEFSLMHQAAAKGHTDVVELLLQSNVSFHDSSKNYPTPLHLAAGNGHLEVVTLFYNYGEPFDQITLHHAAARNHLAVVKFLLSTVGLRDTCVSCQPNNFSQLILKSTMQEVHSYFCETALHAAVSRGLVDIVKVLLPSGKEALECKHHSGKTVLMDAVKRNHTEMVDLLLEHGANVSNDCGQRISKDSKRQMCFLYFMHKQDFLYTVYCVNDSCECGNSVVHVSAKYALWNMAEKLTSGRIGIIMDLVNCYNHSALEFAIVYDHVDFVHRSTISLSKIGRYLRTAKIVELAVTYCSTNVAKLFLNHPANFKYGDVWDLLIRAITWSPCKKFTYKIPYTTHCLDAFKDSNLSELEKANYESGRRLNIIKALLETYQQKSMVLYILYKKDFGMTLLQYAALLGFEDAVKYLVGLGADTLVKDGNGDTPLMISLKQSPVNHLNPNASYRCYTTNDGQFSSCNTTCYDETVRYLIQSQKSNISKCNAQTEYLLNVIIKKGMPLSLYALLKNGVDVNCQVKEFISPFSQHLRKGGRQVSEVFKIFEVDVSVKCGVPFIKSELHLISRVSVSGDFGNFFKPSINKKRLPLQRLIDRHPRGVRILDECYDAEGYLPIHRAAQGGNLDAIKWFKSVGVNTQLRARSVSLVTALDISILSSINGTLEELIGTMVFFPGVFVTNKNYPKEAFEELLRTFFDNSQKNYSSGFSPMLLSQYHGILHVAAVIGLDLLKVVYTKALEIIPNLKKNTFLILDEQEDTGLTPLHFAAFAGHEDTVKYLVKLGADININDMDDNTPLLMALKRSPVNSVECNVDYQCYTTDDGILKSCNTTSYDEIVRYLISSQKSIIAKCNNETEYLLNQIIEKRMPLSLYALLKSGVDVNCQVQESISPFLRHLRKGGRQVSEVLKIFEVDVSVKCGVPFIESEVHLISYVSVSGDFGNFFKPSLNKKRFPLQRLIDRHPRGVRILEECYDAEGYLPIHRAAQGGNLDAIKWFKSIGVNTQQKTQSGLTALLLSTAHLKNPKYQSKCFEELLQASFYTSHKSYSSDFSSGPFSPHLILHVAALTGIDLLTEVYNKALEIIPALKKKKFLILDAQDAYGQTPLHFAAFAGHEDTVKYLVKLGADININDMDDNTPLLMALKRSPVNSVECNVDYQCYTTDDGISKSCNTTSYDEIVRYLISSQKSIIAKCNNETEYLLNQIIEKRMPLSLYALLKSGVDVNCRLKDSMRPFLRHLRKGGKQVSEVMKIFDVDVFVECWVPFMHSELHLISYVSVSGDFGNFFTSSVNKKRSPLQRLIDHHPRGVRILDECYDAEGYLPIHRAAQGGNLAAIKWFKSVGANTQLKTRRGLTALDISILNRGETFTLKTYGDLLAP